MNIRQRLNKNNNELNELGVAELTASISDSNKMTTRNMKQLKTIVKQLRKQLIRLGYIYFTFFRFHKTIIL